MPTSTPLLELIVSTLGRLSRHLLMLSIAVFFIVSQTSAQRAPTGDSSLSNFDIRTAKDSGSDSYMNRFSARPSSSITAALLQTQRLGTARLQSDLKVDVEINPELNTIEIVGSKSGTGFLTGPATDRAATMRSFLSTYSDAYGLTLKEVQDLVPLTDYSNPSGNMAWVEFEQRVNGLPVFRGSIRGAFTASGELALTTGQLVPGLASFLLPIAPTLTAAQAVSRAADNVGWNVPADSLVPRPSQGDTRVFARGSMADDAKAWLLYFPLGPGVARLAWATQIWGDRAAFLVLVDAEEGTVLFRKDLTDHQTQTATYVIYGDDSPAPLSPTSVLPGLGTQAPFISRSTATVIGNEPPNTFNNLGWMTDGTNLTDGNNVEAGIDRNGINGVDAPVVGVSRVFNFSYDPQTDEPLTTPYQNGEVTDVFYWTNVYHDRLYLLGFTEAARNFQNDNFGRGGIAGDRVSAEVQDSSGTNNANFAAPPDGSRGRMQMYIFPGPTPDRTSGLDHDVLLHELTHGTSNRLHSNASGLTSTMAQGMGEGWSDFYARALLSTSTEDPNAIYPAGGWITYQINGVFADNYYYGIRRFPYAVMSNVGANGRPHNPLTFADIDSTQINTTDGAYPRSPVIANTAFEVHNIGEVWCMALLEVRARFITRLGFAVGNQRILQFVTDAMKMDPVNPTLLQGRDSILAAANAGGGTPADIGDIWAGFAVRGMGLSAQVINAGTGRVVEAFDVPGIAAGAITLISESMPNGRLDPSELVTVSLCLTNTNVEASGSVTGTLLPTGGATLPSGPQLYGSIPAGGTTCRNYTFTVTSICLSAVTPTLQVQETGGPTTNRKYSLPMGVLSRVFAEDFDLITVSPLTLPPGWLTSTLGGLANPWHNEAVSPHTSANRAFVNDPSGISDNVLITTNIAVPVGASRLSFWQTFDLENSFDGGVLEISIGGGAFQDIVLAGGTFVSGGYNGVISTLYGSPIGGRPAWTGDSVGYINTTIDLPASTAGQNITLRWRMASDVSIAGNGWGVDTFVLGKLECGVNVPSITSIAPNTIDPGGGINATISGTSLSGASAVTVSGLEVSTIMGSGATATSLPVVITATPFAAPGLRTVTVTTSQGTSFPLPLLTVRPAPYISFISPNAAAPGDTVGGFVSGTNLTGATTVTFSGSGVTASIGSGGNAFGFPVTISVSPSAALSLRTVTVSTPSGNSAPFSGFTVTNTPKVTSITPPTGAIGVTFNATVRGTALTGATSVAFSGSGVTASVLSGGTSTTLPVSLSVDAGASLGPRTFTVSRPGGTSVPFGFSVVLPPVITGINPNIGAPGSLVNATVSGTDLLGAQAVTFSGTGVTAVIVTGNTSTTVPIAIILDSGAFLGLRTVTVSAGGTTSAPFSGFNVSSTPVITSISPNIGPHGGSVPATIFGSNLSGASVVSFSGSGVTGTIGSGGTSTSVPITVLIDPAAALGLRTVTLTTALGTTSPFSGYTIASPPVITTVTPDNGMQGTIVGATITGTDLTGATAIVFSGSGVSASIGTGSATNLPVAININSGADTGLRTFTVTTPAGTSLTFSGFMINPAKRRGGQVTSAELFENWTDLLEFFKRRLRL